jgi:hypothetical protein
MHEFPRGKPFRINSERILCLLGKKIWQSLQGRHCEAGIECFNNTQGEFAIFVNRITANGRVQRLLEALNVPFAFVLGEFTARQ